MRAFYAYPSQPALSGQIIRAAKAGLEAQSGIDISTWEDTDNWGENLILPILKDIDDSDVVFADVTTINLNVTFEIGYSIARGKRVFLTINQGVENDSRAFDEIGIFDTIGWRGYENSEQLAALGAKLKSVEPISFAKNVNKKSPIYLVESETRSEIMNRITSLVKKSRLRHRSFLPEEEVRLSAFKAIEDVAASMGVIVSLAPPYEKGHHAHNVRSAFVAGLAAGMEKSLIILRPIDMPGFLDIRDLSLAYRQPSDVDGRLNDFFFAVHEMRESAPAEVSLGEGILANLVLGDPRAENEMATLGSYFIRTDEYYRACRGEVDLVVGRKGTGKTALWVEVRNKVRREINNIVVDLKPEGYQLVKLKDKVLKYLAAGAKLHLVTAFWEYLIYLEIAYKILEKDQKRHLYDHTITEDYGRLQARYLSHDAAGRQGDFSERMNYLGDLLAESFERLGFDTGEAVELSNKNVNELLHSTLLRELRDEIVDYMESKDEIWLLFDNLDKGWAAFGLEPEDVFILRCLIEASKKVQREFNRRDCPMSAIVFVRNDIYQLLMEENPDFGKENRAALDWSDREVLAEVLKRRVARALSVERNELDKRWGGVCVDNVDGKDAIQYIIDFTFMRPRYLIKIFSLAKSVAINRGHLRIEAQDIQKSIESHSEDVLVDASNELRDVNRSAKDFLYNFIGEKSVFSRQELFKFADRHGIEESAREGLILHMLYYGILGIRDANGDTKYIYDLNYDLKKVRAIEAKDSSVSYVLHPALHPALDIVTV